MMGKFKKWLILKILHNYSFVDPVWELWGMIDEENAKDNPDYTKVDAWIDAIKRLNSKKMICVCKKVKGGSDGKETCRITRRE